MWVVSSFLLQQLPSPKEISTARGASMTDASHKWPTREGGAVDWLRTPQDLLINADSGGVNFRKAVLIENHCADFVMAVSDLHEAASADLHTTLEDLTNSLSQIS